VDFWSLRKYRATNYNIHVILNIVKWIIYCSISKHLIDLCTLCTWHDQNIIDLCYIHVPLSHVNYDLYKNIIIVVSIVSFVTKWIYFSRIFWKFDCSIIHIYITSQIPNQQHLENAGHNPQNWNWNWKEINWNNSIPKSHKEVK